MKKTTSWNEYFQTNNLKIKLFKENDFVIDFCEKENYDLNNEEELFEAACELLLNDERFTESLINYFTDNEHSYYSFSLGYQDSEDKWSESNEKSLEVYKINEKLFYGKIFDDFDGESLGFSTNIQEFEHLAEKLKKNYMISPFEESMAWSYNQQNYYAEAKRFSIQRDGDFGDFRIYDTDDNLIIDNLRNLEDSEKYLAPIEILKEELGEDLIELEHIKISRDSSFGKNFEAEATSRRTDSTIEISTPIIGGQGTVHNVNDFIDVKVLKNTFNKLEELEKLNFTISSVEMDSIEKCEITYWDKDEILSIEIDGTIPQKEASELFLKDCWDKECVPEKVYKNAKDVKLFVDKNNTPNWSFTYLNSLYVTSTKDSSNYAISAFKWNDYQKVRKESDLYGNNGNRKKTKNQKEIER